MPPLIPGVGTTPFPWEAPVQPTCSNYQSEMSVPASPVQLVTSSISFYGSCFVLPKRVGENLGRSEGGRCDALRASADMLKGR